jgi:hypothetical protein
MCDHPVYGEMEITLSDITEFTQNFSRGVRRDIPITAGHDNGMSGGELPAIGWFPELSDRSASGLCGAPGVSRGGFYAWRKRPRSRRSRGDEELGAKIRASFIGSDRTYGARRVWRDLLAEGLFCGLHRIKRLMRLQALKARPRRRRLPLDLGERQVAAVAANVLDRPRRVPAFSIVEALNGRTRQLWLPPSFHKFCVRCARSLARRRSSPSLRCPKRCQIGSLSR